jgi:hypothetical protein
MHHDNNKQTYCGYSRILSPQLSNATIIIHRPVTDGSQRHDGRLPESSSRRPLRHRRGLHHRSPSGFCGNFHTQTTTSSVPRNSSFTVQNHPTQMPHPLVDTPLELTDANHRLTRSQTTIHTQDIPTGPLPPKVVTPRTLRHSSLRVPTGSWRLSPQNLSKDDFCGMDTVHMVIALGTNHWSNQHQANSVIHPDTGKEMEYSALMKNPISSHSGPEVLATNVGACFRAFEIFQEPIHVSSSN